MSLLQSYLDAHGGALSSAAAAERLGLNSTDLRRLVMHKVLVRVCRGSYVDAARLAQADPENAHRLRLRAVLATSPATFAASHQSAVVLLGLPLLAADLELVHVTRRSGTGHGRRRDAFTVHRCPAEGHDFRQVGGEWSGESGLRTILLLLGYQVRPQFHITEDGEFVARVDFYLPELGVVVEFDGAVKYDGAEGREALVREKAREDRIRRLGYGVVRITWSQLYRPELIRERVEAAAQVSSRGRRG